METLTLPAGSRPRPAKNRPRQCTPAGKAREWMAATWPDLFEVARPVPLALRIHSQMAKGRPVAISHTGIRRALAGWTGRPGYQNALINGGPRYGLECINGEVTPEQRARAKKTLAELDADRGQR